MIPIIQPSLYDFEAVIAEFRQAWESGQVTTGAFTRKVEVAVEEKFQVPHAVMVQSCTAGMMLVLKALELQGEVILPAFTWTSTAHAVVWNGLIPVFADIIPGTCTIDPEAVARAINPRTMAIMPVNVFGCPPDYESFSRLAQKHGLRLVYDSAQGLGSQAQVTGGPWRFAGGFGDAEVFSLSPTKVVTAMEGGLITTYNAGLAQKLRQMRDYGKTADGADIAWLGLSARVPEFNAIVARHNFAHMEELVGRRRELISLYQDHLTGLEGVNFQIIPENCRTSGNYFTIFIERRAGRYNRDSIYENLKQQGVQAKKYFYPALHLQRVYQNLREQYSGRLPVTETAAESGLALPLYSHMPLQVIEQVAGAIRKCLS